MKNNKQQLNETEKQQYADYVKEVTPTHSLWMNMVRAFLVGGAICAIGQGILNYVQSLGLDEKSAGTWTSIVLVLMSIILTGFNLYPSIAKFGGAGALVPITGFANSVAAPAIEFQKEGRGVRRGLQDLYHRRAGDPVRRVHQLGSGAFVLAGKNAGDGVNEVRECFVEGKTLTKW